MELATFFYRKLQQNKLNNRLNEHIRKENAHTQKKTIQRVPIFLNEEKSF